MQVEDEAQDHVDLGDEEFVELVPRDGVLSEHGVGLAKQDEDSFNAGGDCLLKAADVGDVKVDVVIDIDYACSRCWVLIGAPDA